MLLRLSIKRPTQPSINGTDRQKTNCHFPLSLCVCVLLVSADHTSAAVQSQQLSGAGMTRAAFYRLTVACLQQQRPALFQTATFEKLPKSWPNLSQRTNDAQGSFYTRHLEGICPGPVGAKLAIIMAVHFSVRPHLT